MVPGPVAVPLDASEYPETSSDDAQPEKKAGRSVECTLWRLPPPLRNFTNFPALNFTKFEFSLK